MKSTRSSVRRWSVIVGAAVLSAGGGIRGSEEEGGGPAFQVDELLELVKGIIDEDAKPAPSVLADVDLRSASAEVKRVARVLRETRLDLSIEKQGPEEVLAVLREVSGLNFAVSPKAKAALVEEKAALTLELRGLPLEAVLDLLALQLGEYRFTLRYGLVVLIRDEEYRPVKLIRFYDVTDLIRPRPDFVAPPLALGSPEEKE